MYRLDASLLRFTNVYRVRTPPHRVQLCSDGVCAQYAAEFHHFWLNLYMQALLCYSIEWIELYSVLHILNKAASFHLCDCVALARICDCSFDLGELTDQVNCTSIKCNCDSINAGAFNIGGFCTAANREHACCIWPEASEDVILTNHTLDILLSTETNIKIWLFTSNAHNPFEPISIPVVVHRRNAATTPFKT